MVAAAEIQCSDLKQVNKLKCARISLGQVIDFLLVNAVTLTTSGSFLKTQYVSLSHWNNNQHPSFSSINLLHEFNTTGFCPCFAELYSESAHKNSEQIVPRASEEKYSEIQLVCVQGNTLQEWN